MEKLNYSSPVVSSLDHLEAIGFKRLELLKKSRLENLLISEIKNKLKDEKEIESEELNNLCVKAMKEFQFLLKDYLEEKQSITEIKSRTLELSSSANKDHDDSFYIIHSNPQDRS